MKRVLFMTWDVGDISKGLEACLGHMLPTHVNDLECWTDTCYSHMLMTWNVGQPHFERTLGF